MDRRPLTRLRIAFLLLGAALLVPLGLLLRSVDARLEAQRRLRHELVAERIFDEMERELTGLLQRENARPSSAYGDSGTRVENWAPFVVGYFTRAEGSAQIIAKPQLAPERIQRLEGALNVSQQLLHPASAGASKNAAPDAQQGGQGLQGQVLELGRGAAAPSGIGTGMGAGARFDKAAPAPSAPAAAFEPQPKSKAGADGAKPAAPNAMQGSRMSTRAVPEDVLKALNRAQEERDEVRRSLPTKRKARAAEATHDDPLSE